MGDKYGGVLEQYDIRVFETYRIRGAYIVNSDAGLLKMAEYTGNSFRIEARAAMLSCISDCGYPYVESYLKNKNDSYITMGNDRASYVLTTWFDGRECNVSNYDDILSGCCALAKLHNTFDMISRQKVQNYVNYTKYNIYYNYIKHTREIKRVYRYVTNKKNKADFELLVYRYMEEFLEDALKALEMLENAINTGRINPDSDKRLCHGNYNYHNIIIGNRYTAITGFEKIQYYTDIWDFYNYLRKVMEKYDWNTDMGAGMLREYNKYRKLTREDYLYLEIMITYPEKFWKIINFYYNSGKVWIPEKNTEKLNKTISQRILRREFIENVLH